MVFRPRSVAGPIQEETETLETVVADDRGLVTARPRVSVCRFRQPLPDGLFLEMIRVPTATFPMGSPHSQGHRDEEPQHLVTVRSFYFSQTTVTQSQWKVVMGRLHPCRGKGLDFPVDRLSWFDSQRFCEKLARLTVGPIASPARRNGSTPAGPEQLLNTHLAIRSTKRT